jgi:hypothetical protein
VKTDSHLDVFNISVVNLIAKFSASFLFIFISSFLLGDLIITGSFFVGEQKRSARLGALNPSHCRGLHEHNAK